MSRILAPGCWFLFWHQSQSPLPVLKGVSSPAERVPSIPIGRELALSKGIWFHDYFVKMILEFLLLICSMVNYIVLREVLSGYDTFLGLLCFLGSFRNIPSGVSVCFLSLLEVSGTHEEPEDSMESFPPSTWKWSLRSRFWSRLLLSFLTWVLETEPRSPVRVVAPPNIESCLHHHPRFYFITSFSLSIMFLKKKKN